MTIVAAVVGLDRARRLVVQLEALTPKFEKLESDRGLRPHLRLARARRAREGAREVRARRGVAGLLLWRFGGDFLALGTLTLEAAIARAPRGSSAFASSGLAATLVLVAAADVPFQFWQHRRQLRMTKQEARDELKETEGRPEVRSRIRQLQRAIAHAPNDGRRAEGRRRGHEPDPLSPSRCATTPRKMKAPRVVAKGADLIAFQIRRVAEAHNVPIFEHPQFARALYHTSEIGKEISPRLYVAVAQVLTYIYQLTGRSRRRRASAARPASRRKRQARARRSTPSCSSRDRGRRAPPEVSA